MEENLTPRRIVKELLNGVLPPRPLFLPIVFSLGAKVENLPLRMFLGNPTKISNSLKQIRGHLRSDGVACYFDGYLEVEALGGTLEWEQEDHLPSINWPQRATQGELPDGLRSPEEAVKSGRVPVAIEVIRRMHSLPNRDFLLMAGVTGPFTLASRITQLEHDSNVRGEDVPESALELAASVVTQVATAFVEAGADLIFIHEEILPTLSAESCDTWVSLLAPAINIVRFYDAMPVLLFSNGKSFSHNCDLIFRQKWDCVLCPPLEGIVSLRPGGFPASKSAGLGITLPLEAFRTDASGEEDHDQSLQSLILEVRPAIVTTAGDVPAKTDIKRLIDVLAVVPRAVQPRLHKLSEESGDAKR